MKTKTEITVNKHGLEYETNLVFSEQLNEWCVNEYELAKMALYMNAKELLPFEQEQIQIANILSIGAANYLNTIL